MAAGVQKEVIHPRFPYRIFLGKNKVARFAFGKDEAEEAGKGLSEAGKRLTGNRGILFTDASSREVLK